MKRTLICVALTAASMTAAYGNPLSAFTFPFAASASAVVEKGKFEAGNGTFLLNGEPFVVKAAELHYPRIPRPYWDQRIKLCKALGMNTICLYTFWNAH